MANGINKVLLIGNIGNDPDVKYTAGGMAIVNASLATSESWKDKTTNEKTTKTEWHKLVFYNKLGELAAKLIRKGTKLYAEGKLNTNKWKDKEGIDRYTTQVICDNFQLLDKKPDNVHEEKTEKLSNNADQDFFNDDIPF